MANLYFVNRYFWPDTSATAQLLSDVSETLAAAGHNITVAASRRRYQHTDDELPAREVHAGIAIRRLWSTNFGRHHRLGRLVDYLSFYLSAILDVARHCGREHIVVVKTDPPLLCVPMAALGTIRGFRLVNWVQDLFPEVAENAGIAVARGPIGQLLKRCRDWSLKRSVANVVIGRQMEGALIARGVPAAQLVCVTNWSLSAETMPTEIGLRRQWGLDGQFVVMYSGNMGEAHDYETILGAMRRLRDESGIAFLFVGGGKRLKQLLELVNAEGLNHVVTHPLQPLEQVAESLRIGDVHLISLLPGFDTQIVPSKYYGILSAGRPSLFIGSENNEIAREVRAEDLGEVIAPGDDASLAAAILRARDNFEARLAQGYRARELYDRRYTRRAALNQWGQLVNSLDKGVRSTSAR